MPWLPATSISWGLNVEPLFLLMDGRSGAGKTTLARKYGEELGLPVIHCDSFYPGWHGLAAAGRIIAEDICGLSSGYYEWDWDADRPGDFVSVNLRRGAIIEGCGALTACSARALAEKGELLTFYIDAAPELRKARALRRDADYAPYWQMWAEQEERHLATMPRADIYLTVH